MPPSTAHPDELLAGYVDGTAAPAERRIVEEHLAACATCQEEIELAGAARAALVALPELGAPGLAEAGVASLRRAAFHKVPDPDQAVPEAVIYPERAASGTRRQRSGRSGRRMSWPQLVAAAAVVAVLAGVIAVPLLRAGGGATKSAEGPQAAAPQPTTALLLIDRGANYTPQTLDALAASITTSARGSLAELGVSPGPRFGAFQNPSALASDAFVRDATVATTALSCLQSGGGTPADAQPIYLERATVLGTPAYVGAFFVPVAKLNIMLVAVSQDRCQPLYSVRQST